MRNSKLILIILATLVITFPVEGKVTIKGGFENREAAINEVITINNASYQSSSLLLPYTGYMGFPSSFLSIGNGKVKNGTILHTIETLTNVRSENKVIAIGIGSVKWGKNIEVTNGKAVSQLNAEINNGKCVFNGNNGRSGITNEVILNNTMLNGKSKVSDDGIQYTASIKPNGNKNREFYSKVKAKNNDKVTEIESYLKEKPVEKVPYLNFDCSINAEFDNNASIDEKINVYSEEGFQIDTIGAAGNHTSAKTLIKSYVKKENGEVIIPTQYIPDTGKALNINVFPIEGVPIKQKLTLEVNIELWK